jgi:hypothetical protein
MNRYSKKIKSYIKFVIFSISITLIFAQGLEYFTQKINLENSLRDKLYSEIGRIIDKSKFVVVVNVELGKNNSHVVNKPTASPGTVIQEAPSDLNKIAPSGTSSMEFLPGVTLSGNTETSPSPTTPEQAVQSSSPAKIYNSTRPSDKYELANVNVAVYLEETLATGAHEKTIESLIKEIIPTISACENCIRIETMRFQDSQEKSELAELRQKIEDMEAQKREDEMDQLNRKFEDLQGRLEDSEDQRGLWEEQALLDREYKRRQDSTRLAKLEADEEAEKLKLDTLLVKAQQKLDTATHARIESETETKKDLIDIIKYGQGNLDDGESDGLLGMKGPKSSDNTLLYVIFGAMFFMMFMMLFFRKGKQEVVYLKPKNAAKKKGKKSKKESKSKDDGGDAGEEKPVETSAPVTDVPQPPLNPYATMALEDENVLRAELRTLRQSAVSMSVNQKEGATEIVKEWLSDGTDDGESGGDEE